MRDLENARRIAAWLARCSWCSSWARPAAMISTVHQTFAPVVLTDVNPDPNIVEVELVAAPADARVPRRQARRRLGVPRWRETRLDRLDPRAAARGEARRHASSSTSGTSCPRRPRSTGTGCACRTLPTARRSRRCRSPPGGTFDYEFTLIDSGFYWYHPHVRGDVQVERGLYAPIVVHDDLAIDVAADRVFVLDDVKLEATGKLSEKTDNLDLMLGRQGNVAARQRARSVRRSRPRPAVASGGASSTPRTAATSTSSFPATRSA